MAYIASVRLLRGGGGVKTPRKRSTRRSGAALRDSVARLVSVAVMDVILTSNQNESRYKRQAWRGATALLLCGGALPKAFLLS